MLQHEVANAQINHVLVERIPRKRKDKKFLILNIYNTPKQRNCDFACITHAVTVTVTHAVAITLTL